MGRKTDDIINQMTENTLEKWSTIINPPVHRIQPNAGFPLLPSQITARARHMPFREYREIPAVNISLLLEMDTSPKHLNYYAHHDRPDSATLWRGRAYHCALLEPKQFALEYAVCPYPNMLTKAAKEWKKEARSLGLCVLTQKEYDNAWEMAEAVLMDPVAGSLIRGGRHECVIQWIDKRTGIACKARLDYLGPPGLIDLKGTCHAIPQAFGHLAARLRYPTRMAWYRDGVEAVFGIRPPSWIITCEFAPTHDVVCYPIDEDVLAVGTSLYQPLLLDLKKYREADRWPGVASGVPLPLSRYLPQWFFGAGEGPAFDMLAAGLMEDIEIGGSEDEPEMR